MVTIVLVLVLFTTPAAAAGTTPRVLVDTWCVDDAMTKNTSQDVTFYKRQRQCKTAEDTLIIAADRMIAAEEVSCKLLEVEAAGGAWRLLHSCRHVSGDHFVSDAWYSLSDRNTLRVQSGN